MLVVAAMIAALALMIALLVLPKLEWTKDLWLKTVGTEIFRSWYTPFGASITHLTAWLERTIASPRLKQLADRAIQAAKQGACSRGGVRQRRCL